MARKLRERGIHAVILHEGWPAWTDAGYPSRRARSREGWLRHPALHWSLALALGGVFLYASCDKILHPREFARIVYQYQIIGPSPDAGLRRRPTLLAVMLPWVELVCGLCLLTGLWRREAAGRGRADARHVRPGRGLRALAGDRPRELRLLQGERRRALGGLKLLVGDLALLAVAGLLAFVSPRPGRRQPSPSPRPPPCLKN